MPDSPWVKLCRVQQEAAAASRSAARQLSAHPLHAEKHAQRLLAWQQGPDLPVMAAELTACGRVLWCGHQL